MALLLGTVILCQCTPCSMPVKAAPSQPAAETRDGGDAVSYEDYMASHAGSDRPAEEILREGTAFEAQHSRGGVLYTPDEDTLCGVKITEGETAGWTFDVPRSGLYAVSLCYYPVDGHNRDIELTLRINDELPFREAESLTLQRQFSNREEEKIFSGAGNEYRREQVEIKGWIQDWLKTSGLFRADMLYVYLEKGSNRVSLSSLDEPVVIGSIELKQPPAVESYKTVLERFRGEGYREVDLEQPIVVQGEDASLKSSKTLYAIEDRTSPWNQPYDIAKIRLNTIGGDNWKYLRQWIEWPVYVEQNGLYRIDLRLKQDFSSGAVSTRCLYIDGEIPFEEARSLEFSYVPGWQSVSLGAEEPYLFALDAGWHTLRLEVATGDNAAIYQRAQGCVVRLNGVYRSILMLTGATPDPLRDYMLEKQLPDLRGSLNALYDDISGIRSELEAKAGGSGENMEAVDRLLVQLGGFLKKIDTIPERLATFSDNINAFSSWVLTANEQPLTIDFLQLSSPGGELPAAEAPWYLLVWNEIRAFFLSFFNDYNYIESVSDEEESRQVVLWLASGAGRDQANVIKSLADNQFTREYGVGLQLRLVDMSALFLAVAADNGPDVALFQSQSVPVNYGMRHALYDLNRFDDVDEVLERFHESASIPFRLEDSLYALPEQQTFLMMFYRTDILGELGLQPPATWDAFYSAIPILKRNHLEIALPTPLSVSVATGSQATQINDIFAALLLQNQVAIFNDDNSRCVLDSLEAVDAFEEWTALYTKYKLPKVVSDINRFRSGETPIVFSSYTFFNTLELAAPEIKGQWEMAPIPGMERENGDISREVATGVTGAVIFQNARDVDAAWDFLKWWTSKEAQVAYGEMIEALMGTSARWPTANLEALEELSWSRAARAQIKEQWQWARGIPEVPGGYYVGRNIDNAAKSVINGEANPRETLIDFVDTINEEILLKRREFKME